jgi:hypothetical protein
MTRFSKLQGVKQTMHDAISTYRPLTASLFAAAASMACWCVPPDLRSPTYIPLLSCCWLNDIILNMIGLNGNMYVCMYA